MKKKNIIEKLIEKQTLFNTFLNKLTPEEFTKSQLNKWSAGQQLSHIVLCIVAILQVFSMEKPIIEQRFGRANTVGRTYNDLKIAYLLQLSVGGKAPERFLPETISFEQKMGLIVKLSVITKELCVKIELFSENELDELCIAHPLLGNLSMREMLYNTIYHIEHHHELVRKQL